MNWDVAITSQFFLLCRKSRNAVSHPFSLVFLFFKIFPGFMKAFFMKIPCGNSDMRVKGTVIFPERVSIFRQQEPEQFILQIF